MRRWMILLIVFLLTTLIACEEEVHIVTGNLFPAEVGNKWEYTALVGGEGGWTATMEVVGNKMHQEGFSTKEVELTYTNGVTSYDFTWYSYETFDGLYWYKDLASDDCLVLAVYPFAVGDSWSFSFYGGDYTAYVDSMVTVVPPDETRYENCYKILYNSTEVNFKIDWKEGIGQILEYYYSEEDDYFRVLDEYDIQ